jgi:hypothetical protein
MSQFSEKKELPRDRSSFAVLIYSSGPVSNCEDVKIRFSRYTAAASSPSEQLAVFTAAHAEDCLQWFLGQADCLALILWDAAYRVPPKEIESFTALLKQSPLVVAARYRAGSIGRGVTLVRRIGGRLRGQVLRTMGLPSDPHSPCLGIRRDAIDQIFFKNIGLSVPGWPAAICCETRLRRIPALEAPVMWSA